MTTKIAVIGNTIMCNEVLRELKGQFNFHRLCESDTDAICDYRVDKKLCPTTMVHQPYKAVAELKEINPILTIVLGYSRLLPPEMIAVAKYGTVGFHAARLPMHRGRAPIPHTILDNLGWTAMTMIYLDEGVDSGCIIAEKPFYVTETDNATSLYKKHTKAVCLLLQEWLPQMLKGRVSAQAQEGEEGWWGKRTAEDSQIDWYANPYDLIRAAQFPYPTAYVIFDNERLEILEAQQVDLLETPCIDCKPNQVIGLDEICGGIIMPNGILITKVRYCDRELNAYDFAVEYSLGTGDCL